jgi:hypothetical protein
MLTKCQNHHHHRSVFDTWTEWAKPQAEQAQVPTGLVLSRFGPQLRGHVSTREEEGQGGGERWWKPFHPAGHVARPVGRHLASYRLDQVGGAPPRPEKSPPPLHWKSGHTPHFGNSIFKDLILS